MDRALLEMEYRRGDNRHTLRLHVRAVDPTPVGADGDLLYLPFTDDPLAEPSVLATFSALATVWAPYYPDTWTLTLCGVWAQTGEQLDALDSLPTPPSISAGIVPSPPREHSTRRRFALNGGQHGRRNLTLAQVNAGVIAPARGVTPTSGGYDARDQDLIGYLSDSATAVVDPAGAPIAPVAVVRSWWDRPVT